jgi:hypothetical protein
LGPLKVTIDEKGQTLVTGSEDGNAYVISAAPSQGFEVLAFTTGIPGRFESLSTLYNSENGKIKVAAGISLHQDEGRGCEKLFLMDYPGKVEDSRQNIIRQNRF